MKTITNYIIEDDVLVFKDRTGFHRVPLKAGETDKIFVFREGKITFILCINTHYGYVGLDAFEGQKEVNSLFLDKEDELRDMIGRRWDVMTPMNIVKRLAYYI
jgi:hypothetical protein